MPIKKELLDILVCPACHGKIELNDEHETLDCNVCKRRYPINDGIPVMLVEKATFYEEIKNN